VDVEMGSLGRVENVYRVLVGYQGDKELLGRHSCV
jgi:hypothetical protein